MNSLRFIQQAIEYEARRQIAIVEGGGTVVQETRLYDPDKGETRSMRSKEEAHDYRYFPDPDLLPLEIEQAWVDDIAASLPELPDEEGALHGRLRAFGLRRQCADRGGRGGALLRGGRRGARRETRRQLGDQRALRSAEEGRHSITESPVTPRSSAGIIT
jgi:aspartyl-tRNA(Asn)/glutamyl-tRNA(Gln) amidotransferase subunit B